MIMTAVCSVAGIFPYAQIIEYNEELEYYMEPLKTIDHFYS